MMPKIAEALDQKPLGSSIFTLVGFIALSFSAAITGWFFPPGSWHAALAKPSWNPPNWLFGPAWTFLYVSMGIAAFLIWRLPASRARTTALVLFVTQLALNALWTPLFFGAHRLDLALVEIMMLDLSVFATLVAFWRALHIAGVLLAPYLAWIVFATALNASLLLLNTA